MARRPDHNRVELYDNTPTAAQRISEIDGFRSLTARNIAYEIGCSSGKLYDTLANLDDMIVHFNGRTLDGLQDWLAGHKASTTPVNRLAQLLGRYLDFLEDNGLFRRFKIDAPYNIFGLP